TGYTWLLMKRRHQIILRGLAPPGVVPVHRVGVLVTSNVSMTLKIWQAVLPWTIFWQLCRPTQQQ
ncbi:MAG TPA: hypothetical protein VE971_05515, partial [Candidatus Eisenbacteria bacterium]|nr:hypothetical protein [Candidatus Eisenbacteria bacterium]